MATQHPPAPEQQLSPVQFSRLAHRGILLGLSISQLIVLGIGVVTVVATIYTGGGMGAHPNRGCRSWGLKPPVSSRLRAM